MNNGWTAAGVIVRVVIPLLLLAFWFGNWHNSVNYRLDGLEKEMREIRELIEERLPPPAPPAP